MGFFHLCNRFIQLLQSSHIDVIAVNTIQEHHRESEAIFTCSCKVGFFSSFFYTNFPRTQTFRPIHLKYTFNCYFEVAFKGNIKMRDLIL